DRFARITGGPGPGVASGGRHAVHRSLGAHGGSGFHLDALGHDGAIRHERSESPRCAAGRSRACGAGICECGGASPSEQRCHDPCRYNPDTSARDGRPSSHVCLIIMSVPSVTSNYGTSATSSEQDPLITTAKKKTALG